MWTDFRSDCTGPCSRCGRWRIWGPGGEHQTLPADKCEVPLAEMTIRLIKTMLLVEDSPGDARLIMEMIKERGSRHVEVKHVESMKEAEEHLAAFSVDILLLDLGLPDVQGMDAVRRVRAAAPGVPLVVLSALDDESLAIQALQKGAQDYLIKGQIEPRELLRALRYAFERKLIEETLFEEKERAQVTLNGIGDAVVSTDISGKIAFLNPVAEKMTGWPLTEAVGQPMSEVIRIVNADTSKVILNLVMKASERDRTQSLPLDRVLTQRDGTEIHIEDSVAPIRDRAGRVIGSVLVFRDVSATRAMAEQIAHLAEQLRERLTQERQYFEEEIHLRTRFEDIVGKCEGLQRVLKEIETVAPTDATVLIEGETGTGKELLARAIHRLSPRHERTFIKLNCAAIPAGLIESELFGHEKGAFTGAIARKIGRVELAHEGTLFLDEVGDLPLDLQPKLLRALQEREIERLGGNKPIKVNIRLIAATNRNLAKMVGEKAFRSDLYYRLKVFPVTAPPLRERTGDIPILVRHFVAVHGRRMGKVIRTIPDDTMQALVRWQWPGNIRELENFLERAVILTRGSVLYVPLVELKIQDELKNVVRADSTLEIAEREYILHVLREAKGQIGGDSGAAAGLGLKRTTLNSKLKKLGIERRDYMMGSSKQ